MSYRSLEGEEEIFEFAKWLLAENSVPGEEPPDGGIWLSIERYFEEKEDSEL